ncbi:hypothetical protein [uncultured Friedmanniella sp.]|uniref:hypothetical protein n=1 Tax=uncultured Friedmanniella sp. TaxID=335381 RepID=UPI0035CA2976
MRLRRSRVVALVAALLCVALAAAALRTAEAAPPYEIVRGVAGTAVTVEDGTITVGDVRVGSQLTRDGSVTDTTPGMFVVVAVTVAATGRDTFRRGDARLLARGDRVYAAYGGQATLVAPPGFQERIDLVFEADPADIDDLTLEVWQAEIIHGYQQRMQVHLGITPGNADQWRAAAPDQAVEADVYGSTRAV